MVSIVIPVFNGAKWLDEAIQSVKSQSVTDWELIIVDDGSEDSSFDIAKSAQQTDLRIKILQITHSGLGAARNRGLDIAKGESILFLDADDKLFRDSLKILFEVQKISNADIIQGKTLTRQPTTDSRKNLHRVVTNQSFQTFSPIEAIEKVLYQKSLDCSVCGKLFKAKLFESVRFSEGILYEDLDIFYKLFEKANKIVKIETPIYFYRKNLDGIIHTWTPRRLDVLDVTRRIEVYMKENHPELVTAARERRYSANFNMFILSLKNGDKSRVGECRQFIKSHRFASLTNPKARLKNRLASLLLWL